MDASNTNISPDEQAKFDRETEIADDTFCALLDDMDETAEDEDVSPIGLMYSPVDQHRLLSIRGWLEFC